MESDTEPIKAELERAYAQLKSMPYGSAAAQAVLLVIERLERELLQRYAEYVEKRDSTTPPKSS